MLLLLKIFLLGIRVTISGIGFIKISFCLFTGDTIALLLFILEVVFTFFDSISFCSKSLELTFISEFFIKSFSFSD